MQPEPICHTVDVLPPSIERRYVTQAAQALVALNEPRGTAFQVVNSSQMVAIRTTQFISRYIYRTNSTKGENTTPVKDVAVALQQYLSKHTIMATLAECVQLILTYGNIDLCGKVRGTLKYGSEVNTAGVGA